MGPRARATDASARNSGDRAGRRVPRASESRTAPVNHPPTSETWSARTDRCRTHWMVRPSESISRIERVINDVRIITRDRDANSRAWFFAPLAFAQKLMIRDGSMASELKRFATRRCKSWRDEIAGDDVFATPCDHRTSNSPATAPHLHRFPCRCTHSRNYSCTQLPSRHRHAPVRGHRAVP